MNGVTPKRGGREVRGSDIEPPPGRRDVSLKNGRIVFFQKRDGRTLMIENDRAKHTGSSPYWTKDHRTGGLEALRGGKDHPEREKGGYHRRILSPGR